MMAKILKLSEVEGDIRPEDFPEGSIYRALIKEYGGGLGIFLARQGGGDKLHILTESTVTRAARKRYYDSKKI